MKQKIIFLFLGVWLFSVGCSTQKTLVVLVPDPEGRVGQVVVKNEAGELTLKEAYSATEVQKNQAPSAPRIMTRQAVESLFKEVFEANPLDPAKFILYFSAGTVRLTDESKTRLNEVLDEVKNRLPCDVYIAGHTDTVGKKELNAKLSLERAEIVRNELVKIGVDAALIRVASHGENDPLVPTPDEVDEPKNRRVEVFIR